MGGRLAARQRRIVAGDELDEDPARCGQEDRRAGTDDPAADAVDALTARLEEGGGHVISIGADPRSAVMAP